MEDPCVNNCLLRLGWSYLICRASIIVVSNFDFPESKILKLQQEKSCFHVLHTFKWSKSKMNLLFLLHLVLNLIHVHTLSINHCRGRTVEIKQKTMSIPHKSKYTYYQSLNRCLFSSFCFYVR